MASRWVSSLPISLLVVVVCAAGCGKFCKHRGGGKRGTDVDDKAEAMKPTITVAPVAADDLCVTRGTIATSDGSAGKKVEVTVPTFRGVGLGTNGDATFIDFKHLGQTDKPRALASGEIRRQIGLKLRAENGCNVVYVMWRLDPKPTLEVSVKVNPGKSTHAECGANGYTKIKPTYHIAVPALLTNERHTMQAEIVGSELFAWIDGELTWKGNLPAEAKGMSGPSGLRSDNLRYELNVFSAAPGASDAVKPKCLEEGEDDET